MSNLYRAPNVSRTDSSEYLKILTFRSNLLTFLVTFQSLRYLVFNTSDQIACNSHDVARQHDPLALKPRRSPTRSQYPGDQNLVAPLKDIAWLKARLTGQPSPKRVPLRMPPRFEDTCLLSIPAVPLPTSLVEGVEVGARKDPEAERTGILTRRKEV